jgi:hypothetical protein
MFIRKRNYILTFIIILSACVGNHSEIDKISGSRSDKTKPKITLYYLHQKRQCKTCKAITLVTEKVIKDFFSNELRQGLVIYENQFLNDVPSLAEKYKCVFAGIYIVAANDKFETISDLTKPSFYLATSNPDSLQKLIVKTIQIKLDSIKKTNAL